MAGTNMVVVVCIAIIAIILVFLAFAIYQYEIQLENPLPADPITLRPSDLAGDVEAWLRREGY